MPPIFELPRISRAGCAAVILLMLGTGIVVRIYRQSLRTKPPAMSEQPR